MTSSVQNLYGMNNSLILLNSCVASVLSPTFHLISHQYSRTTSNKDPVSKSQPCSCIYECASTNCMHLLSRYFRKFYSLLAHPVNFNLLLPLLVCQDNSVIICLRMLCHTPVCAIRQKSSPLLVIPANNISK